MMGSLHHSDDVTAHSTPGGRRRAASRAPAARAQQQPHELVGRVAVARPHEVAVEVDAADVAQDLEPRDVGAALRRLGREVVRLVRELGQREDVGAPPQVVAAAVPLAELAPRA